MRVALSLIPLALLVAGCAKAPQQFGGVPRRQAVPRVVSLSPSTTEIVASNLDARLLVGRTQADDFPASVKSIPVVAEVKPDFEKIQQLKPTIVVYDADLYNEADVKRIEGMGAESFAFKAHTVAGFEKELFQLSAKLGSETGMNDYVTRIDRSVTAAAGDRPEKPPKVAVALGGNYFAGTNSFVAEVVKIAGGTPVGPASDKFAPMSPEALVAASPDVIVLSTSAESAAKDGAALKAIPGIAATPAMKNGKVIGFPSNILLRRGAQVPKLIDDLHHEIMRRLPQ